MKIAIIGTGYVGLPTGVGLAELGNEVVCVDKIEQKINDLNAGILTIYEDGLDDLFVKNVKNGKLRFTLDMADAVKDANLVMLAVGTPPHPVTKEADMKYIHAAAEELALYINQYCVVATKSTVPVGTGDDIEKIIKSKNPNADVDVVSLPEFLREGFAIYDFFNPDRIVIGANSEKAKNLLAELYSPFNGKTEFLFVNRRSSETIKYASNAFLAMKIHYINEMSDFCEKAGADVLEVAKGMGLDSRIGKKFLNPGPGYGGSCFPKDTNAMAEMGKKFGVNLNLIETTIAKNDARKIKMAERVVNEVKNNPNAKIAILGLAFKGGTDDVRESPAMDILAEIIKHSNNITVFDPKAMDNAKAILGDKVSYADDVYQACDGAEIMVILTEWEEFKSVDLNKLKSKMKLHKILDLRNLLNMNDAKELGFSYSCIGSI